MKDIPVVCLLTDKELQKRRQDHLGRMAESVINSEDLENGFRYRFPLKESTLRNLANIVDLERQCCPFLNFKISIEAGDNTVSLEMTGSNGTKEMIRSLFNWNEDARA